VELVRQWGDGRDFLLAKEGAALRAVGLSYRYRVEDRDAPVRFFHVVVEPSARRRGIATALIGRLEARDEDRVYRRAVLPGVAREGEQLLRARGYAPVQRILSMVRAQVALPAPSLPEGYAMREPRLPGECASLAGIYNAAYKGSFAFSPIEPEEVGTGEGRVVVLDDPEGRPAGWFHVLAPGVLHTVQVRPELQGRGLGRALTVGALHVLATQGYPSVELAVDAANVRAVALYEKLGFETTRVDTTWER
jgi:mycothiol synthase